VSDAPPAAARASTVSAEQQLAVGGALQRLGRDDPARFRDALRAFDAAAAASPLDPEPRVRAGELFLEKYNGADAGAAFAAVLRQNPRHPRALLGAARTRDFDGAPGADSLVRRSLAANPRLAAAHVAVATARADAEDYAGARAAVAQALAVDSGSPAALAVLAAAHHLAGDRRAAAEAERRALARNPRNAEVFVTLAEVSARHRLYEDAVAFAARGVALDPSAWRAHALRGINQLRLGQPGSARASLETAFRGDPYDVWVKNTLDLLDATRGYVTVRTPRFTFVADSADAALLPLYLGDLLERGYDDMARRYAYRPPGVRLEIYRRHADFSVRTVGLAGLGALGVSFGPVLAMDSPAARETGHFNWGSTAWHELAHTFTLGSTRNQVPRWLSEGLSVLEERRARAGWGDGASPSFVAAYKAGRIPPVSRLNDGFVRPAYPEQVIHAYYAASLVCEMVEREFGAAALPALLAAYRDELAPEQAVQRALRVDLATLDRRFDAYVRARFAGPLAAPDGALARELAAGRAAAAAGRAEDAARAFDRAKALFPDFAEGESAYWELARLHEARGDSAAAARELAELTRRNGTHYEAHLKLAALLEAAGDAAGAADALERAIYISPYDVAVHQRLAALTARLGDRARAVRERRAVVALAPVDMPDALYQLALALSEAGDAAGARREVLRALELAPTYAPAQELLLRLQPASAPSGGGG
jgi:tetratricopeptide (TPR) repeat protein